MKNRTRIPFQLSAISAMVLAASAAMAQQAETQDSAVEEVYAPLLLETRPLDTRWQTDYAGALQLGLGNTSDDNFMFGQYNGLNEQGTTLIGNLRWQDFSDSSSQWRVSVDDLGLDTREGELSWARNEKLRLVLGFDSQQQVRNNSGQTPFRGSDNQLQLPSDWERGSTTGDFSQLQASLRQFDRQLERDKLFANISAQLNDHWRIDGGLSYEDKQGSGDVGGAFYSDASGGDSSLLPAPVDFRTTEFDLGLIYSSDKLNLEGRLDYSDFDNKDELLIWSNPYSSRNADAGALGLAPDNSQTRGRLSGQYLFSPTLRLQFDGSYALTEQDQDFANYSINPGLAVTEELPRSNLNGEVNTGTFNGKLWFRATPKLDLEAYYKAREREYDIPRDGYRYIRGDSTNQPDSSLTAYNTAHNYLSQTAGMEASYRLPKRNRVTLEYAYEKIERENSAVETTEEDRFTLGWRGRPLSNLSARLELLYGDRGSDTYHWDQRYYALLDVELINATPDNRRYINHPALSQHHIANREQLQGKLDLNWQATDQWGLNFNLLLREDDYDKTQLGLTDSYWQRYHLSANYTPSADISASLYGGYDRWESEQLGRAYRGGLEKNAFEIYAPLPQASDPDQDWYLNSTDYSITIGANMRWQLSEKVELEADYSFVDTESEQDYTSYGAPGVNPQDMPTVDTTLHHFEAAGTWHMREALSLRMDYQYYRYSSDDWALQGVAADTIDTVMTFGARNPNEKIHYVGVSAIYRWQ